MFWISSHKGVQSSSLMKDKGGEALDEQTMTIWLRTMNFYDVMFNINIKANV